MAHHQHFIEPASFKIMILFIQKHLGSQLKTLGTLTLLLLLFPFSALAVLLSLLWSFVTQPFKPKPPVLTNPKKILLTGGKMTKSLQLARFFHRAGHEVFLVETHKYWLSGNRFSSSVKRFYTVSVPEKEPQAYAQDLLEIVQKENIDVFIPVSSPIASYYDSLAKSILSPHCEVIHFDPEVTKTLDNKFSFCQQAASLGLSVPKSFLISDPQEILDFDFATDGSRYILKSIPYDSVSRLDMTQLPFPDMESYVKKLPITKDRPWIMQQFIKGQEYCCHTTVRKGQIKLYCCSKSSAFQVNYQQVDNPEIFNWVQHFVKELNLTGQICFDFIQTEDGKVYPLECNPRLHTAITMFPDHPSVADAYLFDHEQPPIEPLPLSKPTYWLYHELWRLTDISSLSDLSAWLNKVFSGKDAIFDLNDPLPFLGVHHWQIPLLLLDNLRHNRGWVKIDFNIGKLVQLGGD